MSERRYPPTKIIYWHSGDGKLEMETTMRKKGYIAVPKLFIDHLDLQGKRLRVLIQAIK